MFDIYKLEPITHEFIDAIDSCADLLELRKLALRIIAETPPDHFTAGIDPERVGASTDVVELKKLIGTLLTHRYVSRFEKVFKDSV
jgi:hypothetical protein